MMPFRDRPFLWSLFRSNGVVRTIRIGSNQKGRSLLHFHLRFHPNATGSGGWEAEMTVSGLSVVFNIALPDGEGKHKMHHA
jgi:hypothetical protein